jgi:hypothetical protein
MRPHSNSDLLGYRPGADSLTSAVAAENLTWEGWAVPAIDDVLANHEPKVNRHGIHCSHIDSNCGDFVDWQDWREHVSPLIAARIACDPARAVAALASHRTERNLGSGHARSYPQHNAQIVEGQ